MISWHNIYNYRKRCLATSAMYQGDFHCALFLGTNGALSKTWTPVSGPSFLFINIISILSGFNISFILPHLDHYQTSLIVEVPTTSLEIRSNRADIEESPFQNSESPSRCWRSPLKHIRGYKANSADFSALPDLLTTRIRKDMVRDKGFTLGPSLSTLYLLFV